MLKAIPNLLRCVHYWPVRLGFVILLTGVGVSQSDKVCCKFTPNIKPTWQTVVELEDAFENRCAWYEPGAYGAIAYTDSRTIVAGFHLALCHRTFATPLDRHTVDTIIQIDAQTGKLINRKEWHDLSTEQYPIIEIDIISTNDGRFLVRVGRFLKLLSPDFKELKSREFVKDETGAHERWAFSVSPDGRVGLFKLWNHSGPGSDHWFSTDTLDDELVETAPPGEGRISNNSTSSVYFTPPRGGGTGDSLAHVRARGQQESQAICPTCYGIPEGLLTDGTVFLATSPRASFALVSRQGEIIHRSSIGDPIDRAVHFVAASAAPRFAFTFGHMQKRLLFWSSPTGVVVFDTKQMKYVLKLKFDQQLQSVTGPHGATPMLALSPDGTRVAVLAGKVLKSFRVPE